MTTDNELKQFYAGYHDRILDKRYNSPFWLRQYTHRQILLQLLPHIQLGQTVLDAGCGEGAFTLMAATRGIRITGIDISEPNIKSARVSAQSAGANVPFCQADIENLPFPSDSFDVVVSAHVLEHLPNPGKGMREIYRVARDRALIAMPTCLNPACWALLGGDVYWRIGKRTLVAVPWGVLRTLAAFLRGDEGPNEGYGGNKSAPHIWRFPETMRRQLQRAGFYIERFEAGPLIIPYLAEYIPLMRKFQRMIDRGRVLPVLNNLGLGSLAVCRKQPLTGATDTTDSHDRSVTWSAQVGLVHENWHAH